MVELTVLVGIISTPSYHHIQWLAKNWLFGSLLYKMGVLRMGVMYLKSAALLFFKLYAYRYELGLSNELLFIILAQGAAKLWPVKVGGWREI